MQLNKNRVDTAIGVTDEKTTVVSLRPSDDVVITLFKETMKGFCRVCTFNKVPEGRYICDECLAKEEASMLRPYTRALMHIVRHLLPDPPATALFPHSVDYAVTQLGVYTGLATMFGNNTPGMVRALVKLGAWVVARITKLEGDLQC